MSLSTAIFPCIPRDHFVYAPSQWEATLQCNVVSHWLDAFIKWSLHTSNAFFCVPRNTTNTCLAWLRVKPQVFLVGRILHGGHICLLEVMNSFPVFRPGCGWGKLSLVLWLLNKMADILQRTFWNAFSWQQTSWNLKMRPNWLTHFKYFNWKRGPIGNKSELDQVKA